MGLLPADGFAERLPIGQQEKPKLDLGEEVKDEKEEDLEGRADGVEALGT